MINQIHHDMSNPMFWRGHYENIEQREIRAFSITHIEIGLEVSKNKSSFFIMVIWHGKGLTSTYLYFWLDFV